MRVLRLVIAILATTGMELDVIRNAFSPLEVLRWIESTAPHDAAVAGEAGPSARGDEAAATSRRDGGSPNRTNGRPKIQFHRQMNEQLAVRSKTTSPRPILLSVHASPARPRDRVLRGREPEDRPHLSRSTLLHRLCRLLC